MKQSILVRGEDGSIHSVWATTDSRADGSVGRSTLWHGELRGGRWTKAEAIFSAERFDWSGERASVIIKGSSDIHVVVASQRGDVAGLAYIRRINGQWRSVVTPLKTLPSQASAQFIGKDSLAIAFAGVGAEGVRERNGQHIYVIRAGLKDEVWPAPVRVQWSGLDGVRWLRMYARIPNRRISSALTIVWARWPAERGNLADTIVAVNSGDGGATWSREEKLALPMGASQLTQNEDGAGTIHVVTTSQNSILGGNAVLYHATFRSGAWSTPRRMFAGPVASTATLTASGRGAMMLVWGATQSVDARRVDLVAPVSEVALMTIDCPSGSRVK